MNYKKFEVKGFIKINLLLKKRDFLYDKIKGKKIRGEDSSPMT